MMVRNVFCVLGCRFQCLLYSWKVVDNFLLPCKAPCFFLAFLILQTQEESKHACVTQGNRAGSEVPLDYNTGLSF